MSLTVIEGAVAREEWRAALEAALAWWRETRAPEIAALVDVLALRLATPSFDRRVTEESWLAHVEADPIGNLGPALAVVLRSYSGGASPEDLHRRLARLRPLDDPRVAAACVEILRRAPYHEPGHRSGREYEPILAELAHLADVRQVEPLREIVARPTAPKAWLRQHLARVLPALADRLAERTLAPLPDVHALAERLMPAVPSDDALVAAVHANPDEDGPREVLADFWIERGDPRGELVSLQLKASRGTATEKDRKRIAALLRRHEKTWIGAVEAVTKPNRVWDRGFLDVIELRAGTRAAEAIRLEAMRSPALATVRVLHHGHASEKIFRDFVKAAPNVRELHATSKDMLAELLESPPPRLERLVVHHDLEHAELKAIDAAFPRLAKLWFPLVSAARQIAAVAAFAEGRRPRFEIVATGDGPPGSRWLAPWLLAVRGELAALGEVKLQVGAAAITATAGERGLRLHVAVSDLHHIKEIVPAVAPVEHVTLTVGDGGGPDNVFRLYERSSRRSPTSSSTRRGAGRSIADTRSGENRHARGRERGDAPAGIGVVDERLVGRALVDGGRKRIRFIEHLQRGLARGEVRRSARRGLHEVIHGGDGLVRGEREHDLGAITDEKVLDGGALRPVEDLAVIAAVVGDDGLAAEEVRHRAERAVAREGDREREEVRPRRPDGANPCARRRRRRGARGIVERIDPSGHPPALDVGQSARGRGERGGPRLERCLASGVFREDVGHALLTEQVE